MIIIPVAIDEDFVSILRPLTVGDEQILSDVFISKQPHLRDLLSWQKWEGFSFFPILSKSHISLESSKFKSSKIFTVIKLSAIQAQEKNCFTNVNKTM